MIGITASGRIAGLAYTLLFVRKVFEDVRRGGVCRDGVECMCVWVGEGAGCRGRWAGDCGDGAGCRGR